MSTTMRPEGGTKHKNYDLITGYAPSLEHVWHLEQYAQDAEREGDQELASLVGECRSVAGAAPRNPSGC